MMKKLGLLVMALCLCTGLWACAPHAAQGGSSTESPAAVSIQSKGSDTIVNLALAWAEAYQPNHPEVNLSGTGVIDMPSYDNYLTGKLSDYAFPREAIEKSLAHLPKIG